MYAYSSILAALIQRGRTGQGCRIDVSMLEAMVEWMSFPLYYATDGAEPPPRAGAAHATIYPYGPFATGDGKTVMLGLQNEREWVLFCDKVLLQPALARDPRFDSNPKRVESREALRAIVLQVFAGLTAAQLIERLEAAQIANARLNTMADVWAHEQLRARGRLAEAASPVGPLPAFRPPALPDSFEPQIGAIPAVGEHTDALLAELGYSADEIAALRAAGAV
jgi:itaconate CoA-transferase